MRNDRVRLCQTCDHPLDSGAPFCTVCGRVYLGRLLGLVAICGLAMFGVPILAVVAFMLLSKVGDPVIVGSFVAVGAVLCVAVVAAMRSSERTPVHQ